MQFDRVRGLVDNTLGSFREVLGSSWTRRSLAEFRLPFLTSAVHRFQRCRSEAIV
jgi:hypothetical protein